MNRDLLLVRAAVNHRRIDRETALSDALNSVEWHQRPLKEATVECGCEARLVTETDSWTEWETWKWVVSCPQHEALFMDATGISACMECAGEGCPCCGGHGVVEVLETVDAEDVR